jgi:hypothetical protein
MARTVRRRPDPEQQRRDRKRLVWGLVLGVVALLVLGGISLYVRATGGPALPRAVRERIREAPGQAQATPALAGPTATGAAPAGLPPGTPPFQQQVQQVRQAAQVGDSTVRTLYVTDAELTEQLTNEIRKHQEVVEAHGYFEGGKVYLTARVNAKGQELNLTLVLVPAVDNGAARFDAEQVFLGKVAAPAMVADKVREEIGKRGRWYTPENTGIYLERIELKSGLAVLTGRPVRR